MKIHHFGGTRSSRPVWTAVELGLDVEIEHVNMLQGAHRGEAFLAINPHGSVPVLDSTIGDEPLRLIESGAICLHLAESSPNAARLLPPIGSAERALCFQWCFYAASTLDAQTLPAYMQRFRPEDQRDLALIENLRARWNDVFAPFLAKGLGEGPFLCGASFTLADILVGYTAYFANELGFLEGFPSLQAYVGRLTEREGFKRGFARG